MSLIGIGDIWLLSLEFLLMTFQFKFGYQVHIILITCIDNSSSCTTRELYIFYYVAYLL